MHNMSSFDFCNIIVLLMRWNPSLIETTGTKDCLLQRGACAQVLIADHAPLGIVAEYRDRTRLKTMKLTKLTTLMEFLMI